MAWFQHPVARGGSVLAHEIEHAVDEFGRFEATVGECVQTFLRQFEQIPTPELPAAIAVAAAQEAPEQQGGRGSEPQLDESASEATATQESGGSAETGEAAQGALEDGLDAMTRVQLIDLAKANGIPASTASKKPDVLTALRAAGVKAPAEVIGQQTEATASE